MLLATALVPQLRLVFADEFDKEGRPNPANWTYERGFVRNKELQWYQPENTWVEKGRLIIEGRRERIRNSNFVSGSEDWRKNREFADYTSAALETRGLHSWKFGRFEIKAKIVPKQGLWPAIWTLGVNGPWPSNGEIDLLEFYQDTILANTAYGSGGGIWNTGKTPIAEFLKLDPKWAEGFHVWQMDWDARKIKLSIDGRLLNETDIAGTLNKDGKNPFLQPHFLIFNLAIGATGGDPSTTTFPTRFEVDYVRVYQN